MTGTTGFVRAFLSVCVAAAVARGGHQGRSQGRTGGQGARHVRTDGRDVGGGAGRRRQSDHDRRPALGREQGQSHKLLLQTARKLYGTSNEELMDNAKQFAYYPVAVLKGVDNFSNGTISMKFKTVAGDLGPLFRNSLQREAQRRLAGRALQRHGKQRGVLGSSTTASGAT